MIYNSGFVTYSILHCKIVYWCIYNLFHILLSLWHTYGFMECMYICIIIITYIGDPQPFSFLALQQSTVFHNTSTMLVSGMIYSLQI